MSQCCQNALSRSLEAGTASSHKRLLGDWPRAATNAMEDMMTKLRVSAIALAGVLAVAATTTSASAQWRGHHHGGWGWGGPAIGIGAGLAAGALIGSAVAAQPYGSY